MYKQPATVLEGVWCTAVASLQRSGPRAGSQAVLPRRGAEEPSLEGDRTPARGDGVGRIPVPSAVFKMAISKQSPCFYHVLFFTPSVSAVGQNAIYQLLCF